MAISLQILECWRARVLQWVRQWQVSAKRCQPIKTNQPLSSRHLHHAAHQEHKKDKSSPALPPPKPFPALRRPQPHLLAAQITLNLIAPRVPTLPPILQEMAQEIATQNVVSCGVIYG